MAGAKLLAQRCALLESALQGSDRSRLPDLVQAVLAEADRVEAAVQALLGEFSTASPP